MQLCLALTDRLIKTWLATNEEAEKRGVDESEHQPNNKKHRIS